MSIASLFEGADLPSDTVSLLFQVFESAASAPGLRDELSRVALAKTVYRLGRTRDPIDTGALRDEVIAIFRSYVQDRRQPG